MEIYPKAAGKALATFQLTGNYCDLAVARHGHAYVKRSLKRRIPQSGAHAHIGMWVNRRLPDDQSGPYCPVAPLNLTASPADTRPRSLTSMPCGYRAMPRRPVLADQDRPAGSAAQVHRLAQSAGAHC
jgi:hypothetical protein